MAVRLLLLLFIFVLATSCLLNILLIHNKNNGRYNLQAMKLAQICRREIKIKTVIVRHGRHRPSLEMTDPSWSVMVRHQPSLLPKLLKIFSLKYGNRFVADRWTWSGSLGLATWSPLGRGFRLFWLALSGLCPWWA